MQIDDPRSIWSRVTIRPPPAWRNRKRYTPRTQTNPADVDKGLIEVRKRGYAFVDQELEVSLRSLGVPIFSKRGSTIAGLSVSVIDGHMKSEALTKRYLKPLQEAAQEITDSLPS